MVVLTEEVLNELKDELKNDFISKKEVVQVLEENFAKFTELIEKKITASGNQIQGLAKWIELQLKNVERRILADNVGITSHDMAIMTLIELLEEKKIILEGEFKTKINEKMNTKLEEIDAQKNKK